jgi:hypothetical protein
MAANGVLDASGASERDLPGPFPAPSPYRPLKGWSYAMAETLAQRSPRRRDSSVSHRRNPN